MMSLPFLSAKLPLGSSIVVNYNEQSKIQQDTVSKSRHGGEAEEFVALLATGKLRLRSTLYNVLDDEIYLPVFPSLWLNETDNRFLEINIWWLVSHLTALFTKPSGP